MLVPQHPILLHNHMIVMLNESNLPVYTCNDSDQNKLAQSDTIICTTLLHTQVHVPKPLRTEVLHTTHTQRAVTDQMGPRSARSAS